ncbi:MAG: DNA-deoxyinosine glycosylase [Methylotenera sp.]|nr:DNA-deoxyinosine glycosylase [Methylotenera sp.]
MARIYSFKPIENLDAEILILGTMPGRASLAAGQYYAHTRNVFWRITSELLKLDADSLYNVRVQALKSARIAVWDVLQSCARKGSLDAMIERDTLIANDFYTFFQTHRRITHVFFNGAKAEAYFMRYVLPNINNSPIKFLRLPSTSPANASIPFENKLQAWRIILESIKLENKISNQ